MSQTEAHKPKRWRDFRKKSYQFIASDELKALPKQPSHQALRLTWHRQWKWQTFWLCLALGVAAALWLLLFAPWLRVTSVNINGLNQFYQDRIQRLMAEQLNTRRWLIFPQSNILLFDAGQLLQHIRDDVYLTDIHLTRHLPHQLTISGQATHTAYAIAAQGDVYIANDQGIVLARISPDDLQTDLPLLFASNATPVKVGERTLSTAAAHFMLAAAQLMPERTGILVNHFGYDGVAMPTLSAYTAEGWRVIFDTTADPAYQIDQLVQLLIKEAQDTSKLDYIDLRIRGRAYIKEF